MATITEHGLFYTQQLGTPLRLAQVIGLTSTAFLAGQTFANSFAAPALLQAPTPLLVRQWTTQSSRDKLLAPSVVCLSSSVFAYFAYRSPGSSSSTTILYTTAASLLLATLPYSLLALEPINQKLQEKAKSLATASIEDATVEADVKEDETVHALVDRWATLNLGRTLLSGLAAGFATWAALDGFEVVDAGLRIATGANRMG